LPARERIFHAAESAGNGHFVGCVVIMQLEI
jgi:hypothetical protein